MIRSKAIKALIVGLGLSMALSTAAFAEKLPDEEMKIQITSIGKTTEALPPDAMVSSDGQVILPKAGTDAAVSGLTGAGTNGSSGSIEPAMAADAVIREMYDRQLEADRYLFADHTEEIAAKGITVTHTSATNEYVEIGIIPFNEENADFIYQALGKDKIKVVEGVQAVTMDIGLAADGSEALEAQLYSTEAEILTTTADDSRVYMTAAPVSAPVESQNATSVIIAIAAAAVLLGGALLLTRRMKTVKGG
ncbi:MAG: hypothetical protein GX279_00570 [Clostridiaceae bacterium]|jgi:hypothetical protein|nr:hypothetical protein [Clostridiaceae bacterium]